MTDTGTPTHTITTRQYEMWHEVVSDGQVIGQILERDGGFVAFPQTGYQIRHWSDITFPTLDIAVAEIVAADDRGLVALAAARAQIDKDVADQVAEQRVAGATWQQIADDLRLASKQTAWARYGQTTATEGNAR